MTPRIAIIGTGIAGLGAAHRLSGQADLTLYEREPRPGGHAHTVEVTEPATGKSLPVDTGFMVYNEVTYPLLTALFRELGVESMPTDMSFSVSRPDSGFEYRGTNLDTLFARRLNLLRPRYWRFLAAINRFNADAARDRHRPEIAELPLAEYAARGGYGDDFLRHYLLPMSSAVWSTPPELMLQFPAATLLRFFHNHGFLGLHTQHPWLTVRGGSRVYVEKLLGRIGRTRSDIRPAAVAVERTPDHPGALVHTADGAAPERFDRVIIATHADEALALLRAPSAEESALLGPFAYGDNEVVLHTDRRVMPRVRRAWASWNYALTPGEAGAPHYATHYWMNNLQGVSDTTDYFVTVNPPDSLDRSTVLRRFRYAHPRFTLAAIRAQRELPALNRRHPGQAVLFAGSYFRFGFHEDGLMAGADAALAALGRPSLFTPDSY